VSIHRCAKRSRPAVVLLAMICLATDVCAAPSAADALTSPQTASSYVSPPCIREIRYRDAEAHLRAAREKIAEGRLADASQLLLEGIRILGLHYLGDFRKSGPVLDDTGQALQVAQMLEMQGHKNDAVRAREAVLKDRLELAAKYALCGR
jgi:hypothetical protein